MVGVLSLSIIIVSGLFIGMVLGLQGYTILTDYGSEQALGQMVALSLTRELGPVVTALLFAGRAGSALTAEIGLMKATEQLASLEMIGVDPLRRVVAPRFWAGVISCTDTVPIFVSVGCLGGHLWGELARVDSGSFWANMQASVDFSDDVFNGMIKSVVFAVVVLGLLYQGYDWFRHRRNHEQQQKRWCIPRWPCLDWIFPDGSDVWEVKCIRVV